MSSSLTSHQIHPLFTLEKLYQAYRLCRRRKRNTYNALLFEQNLEANLIALRQALINKDYTPERSIAFLLEKPKRREIFAASFRDRVVHHLLVGYLEPLWEKCFIHDSYACRRGKGTHQGVQRLQQFLRKVTANNTRKARYLQLDIQGFFVAINHNILYQRLCTKQKDPNILWLIRQILFTDPTEGCQFRGNTAADFAKLPSHKSLFQADKTCGLPIGNLSSQFFANVYMDALDQFVKHQLKARYYLRYCDDFILVSEHQAQLQQWEQQITLFLNQKLALTLNQRRYLRPVSDGIDFLGYVIRPHYRLVRRRVVHALQAHLYKAEQQLQQAGLRRTEQGIIYPYPWLLLNKLQQRLQAYWAHFTKANSYGLQEKIWQRFWWLTAYFIQKTHKICFRYPPPRFITGFQQQINQLHTQCNQHFCIIQVGQFWQLNNTVKIHQRYKARLLQHLNNSVLSLAWFIETDKRIGTITERKLIQRFVPKTMTS